MEEARDAQKKLVQVETDFETAKKRLEEANKNLVETENALNKVRTVGKKNNATCQTSRQFKVKDA